MIDRLTADAIYGKGDKPGCAVKCAKCGFLRLMGGDGTYWCRRCRYENFDEYFGEGGVNEQYFAQTKVSNDP